MVGEREGVRGLRRPYTVRKRRPEIPTAADPATIIAATGGEGATAVVG